MIESDYTRAGSYTGFADGGWARPNFRQQGKDKAPIFKISKNHKGPPHVKIGTSALGRGKAPLPPVYTGLYLCQCTAI